MHANNLSILATGYKQVCAWHLKKESISFQHFHYSYHLILTSSAHGRRIQLQREERYIEREASVLSVPPKWDALTSTMTVSDNSVSRRQYSAISICLRWRDARTVGAGDEWDITSRPIHISHFQNKQYVWNEYCWLKEHRQHKSLGRPEEIDHLYIKRHLLWFLTHIKGH